MKWIYEFSEGSRDMRDLLGGKGANLAEMARVLGPDLVPAGFTITAEACVAYMEGDGAPPADLDDEVESALSALEERVGRRFGEHQEPLLLSGVVAGRRTQIGRVTFEGASPNHMFFA